MAVKESNADLQKLIALQKLDQEASNLQIRVEKTPHEAETLEQELDSYQKAVQKAEGALEHASRERKRLENDVEDLRSKLSRSKTRLMEVKTNEEYQATLHEIEFIESQIAANEDEILEHMVTAEDLEGEVDRAKGELSRAEKEIKARQEELQALVKESSAEIEKLSQEREAIERELPPDLLAQYRKISQVRHGVAVAEVADGSCQGCHVRLRPQLLAEVKTNQQIIMCENCSRILYYSPSS